MAELTAGDAGTAAAAKGILGWHATHGFCASCGARSEVADAGWRRACPACGAQHFPRTDPVVIMLILHGNAVLLGRSAAWPPGMYSLLAGFMEPGESIEAAVRREVLEEAGVPVGEVDYLSSQPWPFPSSLMIGCRGAALSRAIVRDPVELEDARWVSREARARGARRPGPRPAPGAPGSIARFLIERWLADTARLRGPSMRLPPAPRPARRARRAEDVPEALVDDYGCAGGAALQVAYINPPGGAVLRRRRCTTARWCR